MLRMSCKQLSKLVPVTNAASQRAVVRAFSIGQHNSVFSHAPLVERYRPNWPDADFEGVDESALPPLPPRTVPDELFHFEYRTTTHKGTAEFYKHLMLNPADIRVKATFQLKDMPLTVQEKKIFIGLLGPRYNVGGQRFKLTCERFQSRPENSKYIIFMLETLLADARRIAKESATLKSNSKNDAAV